MFNTVAICVFIAELQKFDVTVEMPQIVSSSDINLEGNVTSKYESPTNYLCDTRTFLSFLNYFE
jgi:hypothetical protein